MSTAAVYTLLRMAERDGTLASDEDPTEGVFEVGGRTSWDFTITVSAFRGGSDSVTVEVESSPTGEDEDSWEQVTDFDGSKTTEGETTKSVTLAAGEEYLRARVTSITGTVWCEVTGSSRFLDPNSAGLNQWVSKKVREYSDGKTRLIERAEQDVVNRAVGTSPLGKLEADLTRPDALDIMRRAIAAQAEHQLQRELLQRSGDSSALVTLREMGELADELDDILQDILDDEGLHVWRGR